HTEIFDDYRVINTLRFTSLENSKDDKSGLPPIKRFTKIFDRFKIRRGAPDEFAHFNTYLTMMLYGIYNFDMIIANMVDVGVLGMYGFNKILSKTFFNYAIASTEWLLESMDILFSFCAMVARFPIIPEQMLDTTFCILCLYETDHSFANAENRFKTMKCSHFIEIHELFYHIPDVIIEDSIVDTNVVLEMPLDSYHADIAEGHDVRELTLKRDGAIKSRHDGKINNFLKVMSKVRERAMLTKMESTIDEYKKKLSITQKSKHLFHAKKNLNISAAAIINDLLYGQTQRSLVLTEINKLTVFNPERQTPELLLKLKLNNATDKNLITPISTTFYSTAIPPIYKYQH
ncbi:hypothetical protein, partial [Salmonella enterica]